MEAIVSEGEIRMYVLEAIFTRRSIRKFTGEPLTDQDMETATKSPPFKLHQRITINRGS